MNAGFEADSLPNLGVSPYPPGFAAGWTIAAPGGAFNPSTSQYPTEAPEGANVAFTNIPANPISQTLAATLQAHTLYTLSVKIGHRLDTAFPGYAVELRAGGVQLGVDNSSLSPAPGQFLTSTVSFFAPAGHAQLGQPLEIRLFSGGTQANFDDVQLDAVQCATQSAGMVSWWKAENNYGDSKDSNTGSPIGAVSFAAGKVGQAFNFTSFGQEVLIGDQPNLRMTTGITIDAWVYPRAAANPSDLSAIVTKWAQGAGDSYGFWIDSSARLFTVIGNFASATSAASLPLNTFSHVAMTYNASTGTLRLYINGQVAAAPANFTPTNIPATTAQVSIGNEAPGNVRLFNGLVDEVEIFSRALSQFEIQAQYDAQSAGKCGQCGDDIVDLGEECDDGNVTSGDCCSSICFAEPDDDPCTDGLFCNGADFCDAATCSQHAGDPCAGGGECASTCNEATDNCFALALTPCTSDNNVCTADRCDGLGDCEHAFQPGPCDDGVFCNGTDSCFSDGSCSVHLGDPCTGGTECADNCSETNDSCFEPSGTLCTDDGNPCTDDICDGNGGCTHPDNSAPCDDNVFCNGTDTCSGGTCSIHAGDPCPGPNGDANCMESCNEASDDCTGDDGEGAACSDGAFCNGNDTCNGGSCSSHTGNPCPGPDGDGNCSESCNESADDCTLADPNGSACTDGLFCNGNDTCNAGSCTVHGGDPCIFPCPPCDDEEEDCFPCLANPCADACNETADNCFDPVTTACLNDNNVCTDDHCDGAGTCAHTPNSAPCDDTLFCNGTDTCGGGSCSVHAGSPCTGGSECADTCNEGADNCFDLIGSPCTADNNVCTDDQCNGAGICGHPNNSASCTDGVFCNGTDTCGGGSCSVHAGNPCTGGSECADTCNEGADNCFDLIGSPCTADNNVCTDDQCNGAGTCIHPNNNATCNDNNSCTSGDTCSGGVCSGTGTGTPCPTLVGTVTADVYVDKSHASTNYGSSTLLTADNDPMERIYVRVHLTGITGQTITTAKLNLKVANVSGAESNSGGRIRKTTCTWNEPTVTWSTPPPAPIGSPPVSLGMVTQNQVVSFDVKSHVLGGSDGDYCFVIDTASNNGVDYNSLNAPSGRPTFTLSTSCTPCGGGSTTTTSTTSTTTTTHHTTTTHASTTTVASTSTTTTTIPSGLTTLERRVSAKEDDAEEDEDGDVDLSSSDLELVDDGDLQTVGIRFRNVTVPRNATIVNAYVQFKVDETTSGATSLRVYGQLIGNALVFTTMDNNVSSRGRTGFVTWNPSAWNTEGAAGAAQRTPDLKTLIQQIVNQSTWNSGQALAVIITGTGKRVAEAYDGESSGAPLIHIEYTP